MAASRNILCSLKVQDDWETPSEIWRAVSQYLPPKTRGPLWMPFWYNGQCPTVFREMGWLVEHKQEDFFTTAPPLGNFTVVDNPPFSRKRDVLSRMVEQEMSFMLILPLSCIATQYFARLMKHRTRDLRLLFPAQRMRFTNSGASPPFNCIWVCYRCEWLKESPAVVFM